MTAELRDGVRRPQLVHAPRLAVAPGGEIRTDRQTLDQRALRLTVKLSRIRPFCGRILLDQRLRINDLAVAPGGENAAKLLNLTVPSKGLDEFLERDRDRELFDLPPRS